MKRQFAIKHLLWLVAASAVVAGVYRHYPGAVGIFVFLASPLGGMFVTHMVLRASLARRTPQQDHDGPGSIVVATLGVVAGLAATFAIGIVSVLLVSAIESFVESSR